MAVVIEDRDLQAAQITEEELYLEIALLFYQQGRYSLGRASELAKMDRISFQKELGKRQIPVNYDIEEFEKDLKTLGISVDDSNQ